MGQGRCWWGAVAWSAQGSSGLLLGCRGLVGVNAVDAQGPGAAVVGVDADKVVAAAQVMIGTEGHPCLGHGSCCWSWLARSLP